MNDIVKKLSSCGTSSVGSKRECHVFFSVTVPEIGSTPENLRNFIVPEAKVFVKKVYPSFEDKFLIP